jgi:hypothetical protein
LELETIADFRMAERAFNDGWDIPNKTCESIVAKASLWASCGDPDIEDKAGRLLLAIAKFTQAKIEAEETRLEREHKRKLELIELAHKLGIVGNDSGSTGVVDSQSARISNE